MLQILRQKISEEIKENESLAPHTTFKIGGPAEFFFLAKTSDDVMRAVHTAQDLSIPYFVFGGGSNILVADDGVRGLVIKMANRDIQINGETVLVDAGIPSGLLALRTTEAGLTGFEWAAGLPGTVGGAIRGNAGMFGGEMKDNVLSVRVLCGGVDVIMSAAECHFGYRESIFKHEEGRIILSATLFLKHSSDSTASKALLRKYLFEKKEKQPIEYPTAGCMFTNWKPRNVDDLAMIRNAFHLGKDEKIPLTSQGTVPAGWIIDRAGFKGMKRGQVQISEKHGNFFLNLGKASANDVFALTREIKKKVNEITKNNVSLDEEVKFVGFHEEN